MSALADAPVRWEWHTWATLSTDALYALLRLRSAIFVVEQNCVFPDMDGRDSRCQHLCGWDDAGLAAYLRLVPPGVRTAQVALGRVVVRRDRRGQQLGRALMQQGLLRCAHAYPRAPVQVSAQQHLEPFYGSLGFRTLGAPYLEDGIWHVDMQKD